MPVRQRDVVFDLTRLATRFSRTTPNGIDRVDLGYAQHFLSEARGARGALFGPAGLRAVDNAAGRAIVDAIGGHWRETGRVEDDAIFAALMARLNGDRKSSPTSRNSAGATSRIMRSIMPLLRSGNIFGTQGLFPGRSLARTVPEGAIYVSVSQFPLWLDGYFRWLDRRPDIKPVFFIHDLLPIIYPEFFPPTEAQRHEGRMRVLARRGAGIIVASTYTQHTLEEYFRRERHAVPPIRVIPLPPAAAFSDPLAAGIPPPPRRDYFVAVGTIEPRKNQLLLLNIWRELAERFGDRTPALVLVGARGWENENIVDMLKRCPPIQPHVHEVAGLSTPALRRVMAGARAVLMPTLAEGYGLPIVEARAAGVPLIVSNVPAIAAPPEPGLTVLDPLDGLGWLSAIADHISHSISTAVTIRTTPVPTWTLHLEHTEDFLGGL